MNATCCQDDSAACLLMWGFFHCNLMAKNESGDSGDEFGHEDQSQKHGVLQRIEGERISHRIKQKVQMLISCC